MIQMNIHEAKTNLSYLLEKMQEGEKIVIAKAGKPLARLNPYQPIDDDEDEFAEENVRELGGLEGQAIVPDDWDSPETNNEIWGEYFEKELGMSYLDEDGKE